MPPDPLTDEEIAKLRSLIPYADAVREEAEYDAARRLILRRWKGMVIGIAAVLAALGVIYTAAKSYLQHLIGG